MPKQSNKRIFYFILIFVVIVLGVGHVSPTAAQDLLFEGDFETGDLTGFYWHQNKPEVVTAPHPVRAGNYSMKAYVHRYESEYSWKTVVHVSSDESSDPATTGDAFQFNIGEEYWIGLSVYLPSDFVADVEGNGDLVFQIQATPDAGEDYRSPILAIYIGTDKWDVYSRWDSRENSGPGNQWPTGSGTSVYSESFIPDRGKWTDWVFHVKWSYESDGLLKIWKNGTLVGSRSGPNCANDASGPYPSLGIYKWCWQEPIPDWCTSSYTDYRLVYHDELRIAGAGGSYEDVAPGGGSPPASPDSDHCFPLGDIDCSGRVNGLDFGYLVSHWGTTDPQANLDDDGVVDAKDALISLSSYGQETL